MLLLSVHDLAHQVITQAQPPNGGGGNGGGPVPNVGPIAPPGAGAMNNILGYLKWMALAGCAVAFMGGLIAFTAGRVIDNRRYGNTGSLMMLASIGGALLFGIGPQILNTFAGTQ